MGDNRPVGSGEEILTVGHSNQEERRFLELLGGAGVEVLADVRANPRSRYPQFNRSALAAALEGVEIAYSHLGKELGGRRDPAPESANRGWEEEWFRGYADHMASADFASGLGRLEELARHRRVVVMCAEADWRRCHRRLIADALLIRGWSVFHLDGNAGLEGHQLTEFAEVDAGRLTYPERQTSLDL
jgi:uncharacterized protein (DUF488 family)